MSDWREMIPDSVKSDPSGWRAKIARTLEIEISNKKAESNNSNNSKNPSKNPKKPIIADIALRSESEFLPIATDRLKEIAGDIMWSADDLLDWFKDDFQKLPDHHSTR